MKSMTGYGRFECQSETAQVSVEIKGYNNRFLEISINAPPFLSPLESRVREYLSGICRRGTVEVYIRYKEFKAPLSVAINEEAARAYYEAALKLSGDLGLSEKPSLADILSAEGVLSIEHGRGAEEAGDFIFPALERAALIFDGERGREGGHTKLNILEELSAIEKSFGIILSFQKTMDERLKVNVKSRFEELLGNDYDENRVLSEVAALLVKWTIAEEVSRLAAHLAEFRASAEREEDALGKKLDFLCQEIHREINTIGSKASMIEISREVVPMKNALENIREQLRNVE